MATPEAHGVQLTQDDSDDLRDLRTLRTRFERGASIAATPSDTDVFTRIAELVELWTSFAPMVVASDQVFRSERSEYLRELQTRLRRLDQRP